MELTLKSAKRRGNAAFQRRRTYYDPTLAEIYDYMLPWREAAVSSASTSGGSATRSRTEGENRVDKVFDSTAPLAAFRFAGRMQSQLTPLFQQFALLEPGPLILDEKQRKSLSEEYQKIGRVVFGVLASGNFHTAMHELYLDLYAGTGAMLMLAGDERQLVRCRTVPMNEIALEEGPYGPIWAVWWSRKYKARMLRQMWPNGKFGPTLKAAMERQEGETDIDVTQHTCWDEDEKRWRHVVYTGECRDEDGFVHEEKFKTSPWITPRFFCVPGEVYGRGPAHLALPTVKSLNRAIELELIAAAFAILGIWTVRHDGVFNPETATLEPGTCWPVAYNGGPLGPTVQALPMAGNFDLSRVVIEDQRNHAKMALFDNTLPPDAGAVRSPTEIVERMKIFNTDNGGVMGRLTLEVVVAIMQRAIDILESKGKLPTNITIDQVVTQARVVAPIAMNQQMDKLQPLVNAQQIISMLYGREMAIATTNVERVPAAIMRMSGVEEDLIGGPERIEQAKQIALQMLAAQMNAEQAKGAPPPADPHDIQQNLVNGGGTVQ